MRGDELVGRVQSTTACSHTDRRQSKPHRSLASQRRVEHGERRAIYRTHAGSKAVKASTACREASCGECNPRTAHMRSPPPKMVTTTTTTTTESNQCSRGEKSTTQHISLSTFLRGRSHVHDSIMKNPACMPAINDHVVCHVVGTREAHS